MSLTVRTTIFAVMVAVTAACCLVFSNPATNPASGVVVWLPEEIPGCIGERGEMGPMEEKWLPPDTTYRKMTYLEKWQPQNLARYRALNATLIVAGSDSRSLHRPVVCLRAQGWAIKSQKVVRLDTTGGPLEVMDYHLVRVVQGEDRAPLRDAQGNEVIQRAHYVYWWIGPDDSTAIDEEKEWKSVWNSILKGENERWAYPSVMMFVDERKGDDRIEETRERIFSFIEEYAPMFQKSLGATDREDATPLIKIR